MIKKNLKMKQAMALALTLVVTSSVFSTPVLANTVTDITTQMVTKGVQLEDGVYSIPVKMWHVTKDQASSGNGALSQTATIIVKDGKANLVVTYLPMTTMGKTTYVSELNYLTDMKYSESGTLDSYKENPTTVLSTYNTVDEYNAEDSKDPTVAGKAYPKDQMLPITIGENEILVSIYVPISAPYIGYGKKHEARLILDYDNIKAIDGSIFLSQNQLTLSTKETAKLNATVFGDNENVTYTSSDKNVATVSKSGVVTAKSLGTATITATANGVSTTCEVKVALKDGKYQVPVSLWHAYKNEASMGNAGVKQTGTLTVKNGEATLTMTFVPMTLGTLSGYLSELNLMTNIQYDANKIPVSYDKVPSTVLSTYNVVDEYNKADSTDSNVAGKAYPKTVSIPVELGQEYTWVHMYVPVMGVTGAGDCEARVKIDYSVFEPTITLNKTKATITAGTTTTLKANIHGLSSKAIWTSSNKKVATVSSTGKVTAKKAGKAVITVTANGIRKKVTITVKNPTLKVANTKVSVKAGKTAKVKATVSPKLAISYTSSNKKIATVSKTGVITGKKKGTAKITVSCYGAKKVVTVTVK